MEPKYSILLCNQSLEEYQNKIDGWLHKGIKVIWFGDTEDVDNLKHRFADYSKALLLLAYEISRKSALLLMEMIRTVL